MSRKPVVITCICGATFTIWVVGNNNANGKKLCSKCKRNITVHFRRHKDESKR